MEDSITESELKRGIGDEAHQGNVEEVNKGGGSSEEKMEGEEEEGYNKRNGGLINHLISNLVSPSSPKSRESVEGNKTEVTDEEGERKEKAHSTEDQVELGGRIINNLISNFFHHSEGEGEEKDKKINIEGDQVDEGKEQVQEEGVNGEMELSGGGGGGGIINNLISNLFHQNEGEGEGGGEEKEKSTVEGKGVVDDGKEQVQEECVNGEMELGGGGIINNLISNFFYQNEGEGEGGGEEKEKSTVEGKGVIDDGKEQVKKVEEPGGGGGIINNIVSHLPVSLQDSSVPVNDEASILIHSIIHD
ncbi:hypothetical protein BVC80_9077g102 [Macleaya cordata]|uniref:Uncharacterized protein n=1 Tax=Macleaya cordata TaxID=56857 RepID=A0A200PLT0_MACCD|nr:hypothetical protein BVC80_9077g102 [Macleaya cordata]